jgi:hypothetical protein
LEIRRWNSQLAPPSQRSYYEGIDIGLHCLMNHRFAGNRGKKLSLVASSTTGITACQRTSQIEHGWG